MGKEEESRTEDREEYQHALVLVQWRRLVYYTGINT
jgi:hypothetical protein